MNIWHTETELIDVDRSTLLEEALAHLDYFIRLTELSPLWWRPTEAENKMMERADWTEDCQEYDDWKLDQIRARRRLTRAKKAARVALELTTEK